MQWCLSLCYILFLRKLFCPGNSFLASLMNTMNICELMFGLDVMFHRLRSCRTKILQPGTAGLAGVAEESSSASELWCSLFMMPCFSLLS